MGYRTLFEGSGIHHSNSGLQITPDKYINEFFMLVFDLTPDLAASEGHTSEQNLLHTSQLTSCNKKRLYQHLRRHQATNFEVSKFLKIQKSFGPPFLGSWGYKPFSTLSCGLGLNYISLYPTFRLPFLLPSSR